MHIYLVGGAVRDKLLQRTVIEKDWVVVGATPEQLLALGYKQVGKDFPVFLHPETNDEYALARTERKQGKGYYGFECYAAPDVTLEDDLFRRDLTINAIAEDESGNLFDPTNGLADIENKVLRHVSIAFKEDPLRVLRIARFAARYHYLGFTIADETMALMTELSNSGELSHLTPERIWKETERALSEKSPQVYFEVLRQCGALKNIIPELDKLWGIPNPKQWHPEIDSGIHTMMVLEQAALMTDNTDIRFAAVCHDLGKGETLPELWPSHKGHELSGVDIIKDIGRRLKIPNQTLLLAQMTSEFHILSHRAFDLNAKTIVKLLEKTKAYRQPEIFKMFLMACEADFRGRTGFETRDYPQRSFLLEALEVTSTVDTAPFIAQGITGKKIGERIHKERIFRIKNLQKERDI